MGVSLADVVMLVGTVDVVFGSVDLYRLLLVLRTIPMECWDHGPYSPYMGYMRSLVSRYQGYSYHVPGSRYPGSMDPGMTHPEVMLLTGTWTLGPYHE